jgi:5,10-methylenetetrahydromethanopterin reductase
MPPKICLNILPPPLKNVTDVAMACERVGLHAIGIVDSPLVAPELYLSCSASLFATSRLNVFTAVTNPVTRHPSVAASAALSLSELAPQRVAIGLATGDSALWGVGLRPAKVAFLREYIVALKALMCGEEATWQGHTFRMHWDNIDPNKAPPVYVACSGPRVLKMAAQVADGVIVSMGYSPEDIAYVRSVISEGCAEVGRETKELEVWWFSEFTFGPDPESAMEFALASETHWLIMGGTEGKRIPEEYKPLLRELHTDTFDLDTYLKDPDRGRVLAKRAKKLGISDWLVSRSARLWGTPNDIGNRFQELRAQGLENLWLAHLNWDLEQLKAVEMLGTAIGR